MAERPDTAREDTILSLSKDIKGVLTDFQDRLDNRFERAVMAQEAGKGIEQYPNMLDEIIKELEEDKAWLTRIVSFVSSDVLPKIS